MNNKIRTNDTHTLTGKFVRFLTWVPPSKFAQEHLDEVKSSKTASKAFKYAMGLPKKILEAGTVGGKIDGCAIGVSNWVTSAEVLALQDKICSYEPYYQPEFRNKSHLRLMPQIKKFFESPDHCRITDFSFELRLCG